MTAKELRHRFARQNHSDDDGIIHMENQSHGKQQVQLFDAGALQEEEAAIVAKGSFDEYKKEDIRGGKKKRLT